MEQTTDGRSAAKKKIIANVFANQIPRLWSTALQFVATPFIAAKLGSANYGFVGFYLTLLAALMFLSQGPSSIIARELARSEENKDCDDQGKIWSIFRKMESISLITGILSGLLIVLLAPLLVKYWLNIGKIPIENAITVLRLIGICIACQWSHFFYTSCYTGAHRQVDLAPPLIIFSSLQNGITIILIGWIAPRIEIYFAWTAISWTGFNLFVRFLFTKKLSRKSPPLHVAHPERARLWRFGCGTTLMGFLAATLGQIDKFFVSSFASLDLLAAYTLSFSVASFIITLSATPVGSVLMPIMSKLGASGDTTQMAEEYHRWTQVIVFIAIPATATLIVFPEPFLKCWLGATSPFIPPMLQILPWAAAGTFFSALNSAPTLLQWGNDWTGLSVKKQLIAFPIYTLILWLSLPRLGVASAAGCWLLLNLGYYLFELPIMHRHLLKDELWAWWGKDTFLPICASTVVYFLGWLSRPNLPYRYQEVGYAVAIAMINQCALIALLPHTRDLIRNLRRRAD